MKTQTDSVDIVLHRIFSPRTSYGQHIQNTKPPYFLKSIESILQNRYCEISYKFFDDRITKLMNTSKTKSKIYILDLTIFDIPCLEKIALDINKEINPALVIIIGQAATAMPSECLSFFNDSIPVHVIGGEPEGVLEKFVFSAWPNIDQTGLKTKSYNRENLTLVRNQYSQFNEAPPIFFSKEEIKSYQYLFPIKHNEPVVWGHIIATRGCPHSCSFCTHLIRESYGSSMRKKNISTIIAEIKSLQSLGVNMIAFGDDDLTGDQDYLKNLCISIIEQKIHIKWTAHARIDECTFELLKLMKTAGCSLLRFGLESGSEEVLKSFQKTRLPESWWKQINTILPVCKQLNIQTCGLFILGSPQDKFSTHLQTFIRIMKSPLDLIQLHFFTPYEDTIESKKLGAKAKPTQHDHYAWNFVNYSQATRFEVRFFYILIYICFYLNPIRMITFTKNYSNFFLKNHDTALTLIHGYIRVIFQFIPFKFKTNAHAD